MEIRAAGFFRKFSDEILLNSGQYALFYILMNFSSSGLHYFQNLGHTLLLLILVGQTSILVLYGSKPGYRFLFSLLAPAMYTLIEMREGWSFVLNMGHMFFWISSLLTGGIQALSLMSKDHSHKRVYEFVLTGVNVAIFMLVYFYFDTKLTLEESLAAGAISVQQLNTLLEISRFIPSFASFLKDPAHIFILAGGVVLTLSLGIGRIRILQLSQRITELFGQYVDSNVRDRILSRQDTTISEARQASILFSDIRDFTTLSENESPEKITAMLNEYFTWWDREVRHHSGTIDKYIGDAVMVIFGLNDPESAAPRAVECAQAMYRNLPALRKRLRELDLPAIGEIGIGINYGRVIIGDIGSESRRNFTVIGDTVNVASRLESLTKQLKCALVVSESLLELLPGKMSEEFVPRGRVMLKGRREPTRVYSNQP